MSYEVLNNNLRSFSFSYDRFFFNTDEYLASVSLFSLSFFLVNTKQNTIAGEVHFFVEGEKAVSPLKASFGSFHFDQDLKVEPLFFFIEKVEEGLKARGVKESVLRNYPFAYAQQASLLTSMLMAKGWEMDICDMSFYIELGKEFSTGLRESEHNRLKRAGSENVKASIWEEPDLEEVYTILKTCRELKSYPMSLSLQQFKDLFLKFPTIYKVFKVTLKDELIAVGVTVHISESVLYNFYVGDVQSFKNYSPVVVMIEAMVKYGKDMGYKILDLGIGTDSGKPNFGLLQFKQNLGGIPTIKPTFIKTF